MFTLKSKKIIGSTTASSTIFLNNLTKDVGVILYLPID